MPKVSLETVAEVLTTNNLGPDVVGRIVRELQKQAQIEAEEAKAAREPPEKKQFVVLLSDPQGALPQEDLVGWVLQLPESDNPGAATERVMRAAYEFNLSKKGRQRPVKSIGEAIEAVGPKFFKEQRLAVKTKLPVTALRTDNVLPKDAGHDPIG